MLTEMNLKTNFNRVVNILILLIVFTLFVIIFILDTKIPCVFKNMLGISCPGCGMTRAIHEILHFNFFQSIKYNILALPLVVLGIISTPVIIYDIIFNKNIFITVSNKILTKYWYIVLIIVGITMLINNINKI